MNFVRGAANAIGNAVNHAAEHMVGVNHGHATVHLERLAYVGGDVLSGTVHLTITHPVHARGVLLKVHGYEAATFEEWVHLEAGHHPHADPFEHLRGPSEHDRVLGHHGGHHEHFEHHGPILKDAGEGRHSQLLVRHETHEFFEEVLSVYGQDGMLQPGQYQFPFQYKLHDHLAGTFYETGGHWGEGSGYRAEIMYVAEAVVDTGHGHTHAGGIRGSVRFVVNEKFDRAVAPAFKENKTNFMLTKGSLTERVWLDHNCYFPGNTVIAKMEANNTSTKRVKDVSVKVTKTLTMHAGHDKRCISTCIYRKSFGGLEPSFYGVRFLPFQVPIDLMPTTKQAKHVRCEYVFTVECSVPGAFNLACNLDFVVLAPQFLFAGELPPLPAMATVPGDVSYRPPWQPDAEAAACNACGGKFSLFNRRHHCRHCGKVFCKKCTPHMLAIPNLGYSEAVRVCDGCQPVAVTGGKHFQELGVIEENNVQEPQWTQPEATAPPSDDNAAVVQATPVVATTAPTTQQGGGGVMPHPPAEPVVVQATAVAVEAAPVVAAAAPVVAAAAPPITAGDAAIDHASFENLKAAVKGEAFSTSKMSVLQAAAGQHCFTCEQVRALLAEAFDFGKDRCDAGVLLWPRVVDQQNLEVILSAFSFESDKKNLRARINA